MNPKCPRSDCLNFKFSKTLGPASGQTVRHGGYRRSSDSRWIERFWCRSCKRSFSRATRNPCFGQRKRRFNSEIERFYASGLTQRRLAKLLHINRKTVVRKIRFLAERARRDHKEFLAGFSQAPEKLRSVQFDDLETSEHTKCKPLSVALAVEPKTRKILSFQVSRMPAKGLLAEKARKKYGRRKDERPQGWSRLARDLGPILAPGATLISDENPHYPKHVISRLPYSNHVTHKGRRGCIAGQGELKKIGFDPLFSLNHTCAMLRANMSRLFRRTWSTTKTEQGLLDHLSIYVSFHNRVLTSGPTRKGASFN